MATRGSGGWPGDKSCRPNCKALDKAGKYYKFVELDGADHFLNTLFYDHQKLLFESMIEFLQNDCGTMSSDLQASTGDWIASPFGLAMTFIRTFRSGPAGHPRASRDS